jgi:hypothetical protein
MVVFCEHGHEPLGSIKGRKSPDQLSELSFSQELCSIELVAVGQMTLIFIILLLHHA